MKATKEAWENLKKTFAASTMDWKFQILQVLNNIMQRDMFVTDYTLKIKDLCESIISINVPVNDDEMV